MGFKTWQAFMVAISLMLTPLPAWAGANLQQLLQMGADALKTGNSFLATKKYQEAVDKNPNSHQAWYALAEAQYKSKNYNAAIKSVSKALSLAPDRPMVLAKYHTGRAWACYKAGLHGQAVSDMERATELAPNNRQYKKWLNGARQKEQQKGPGPSLSSVLGYEEMPRSYGSDSERSADREQEYQGEDERQPYNEDDEERSSGEERQEEERYQDDDSEERQSERYREDDDSERSEEREESSEQERYQEEQESDSRAQGEDDGADVLSDLSPRCRKSYFVCMAGCADISGAKSRGICENACRNAAKACQ